MLVFLGVNLKSRQGNSQAGYRMTGISIHRFPEVGTIGHILVTALLFGKLIILEMALHFLVVFLSHQKVEPQIFEASFYKEPVIGNSF